MNCDRLGGVGAQRLLEHDQRPRLEPRRRLAAPGRAGSAPRGLAEGDHPPARRRCALERALRAPAAASARRPPRARRARRSRSCAPARRRSSVTPLHFHCEENGTSATTCAGRARVALGDHLRGCGCARRPSARSGRAPRARRPAAGGSATSTETSSSVPSVSVPVLSTQIVSTAASASVALICWTSVFMPRQPHRGDREGDAHQQHQALGDQRDQAGGRGLRAPP